MRLLRDLVDLVFPRRCAGCDAPLPTDDAFCAICRFALSEIASPCCSVCGEGFLESGTDHPCGRCARARPPFHVARAPFVYGGPLADAVRRMKYGGRPDLAAMLAPFMIALGRALESDVVVPVPLSRPRLLSRGYNQSALLAGPIARALGRPLDTGSLRREREAPPQAGRTRTARVLAVRGAFGARGRRLRGLSVLLVDDVLTTGATAAAATRALLFAGAAKVSVLTLARAGDPV